MVLPLAIVLVAAAQAVPLADSVDLLAAGDVALPDCDPFRDYEGTEPIHQYADRDGCTYFCEGHIYDSGYWYGSCISWPTPTLPGGDA